MRVDMKTVSSYYKQMQIETLPQYNRVAFLHETMYNTVKQATMGEKEDVRSRLDSVQNILVQLIAIVKKDGEEENDVADGLLLLYDYLYAKLENSDTVSMNDALEILSVLHETFDKLIKKRV